MKRSLAILMFLFALSVVSSSAASAEEDLYLGLPKAEYDTYNKLRSELFPKAYEGDADAMDRIGGLFEHGLGLNQDYWMAALWYRKASDKGHKDGAFNLGRLYRDGLGVDKDLPEAFQLFTQAAEKNYPPAEYALGQMYAEGWGTDQNMQTAYDWVKKSAEQGYPEAQYQMGLLLAEPGWVYDVSFLETNLRKHQPERNLPNKRRDTETAKYWLQKALENGNLQASVELGNIYSQQAIESDRESNPDSPNSGDRIQQSKEMKRAKEYCRIAAFAGYGEGMVCYILNYGVRDKKPGEKPIGLGHVPDEAEIAWAVRGIEAGSINALYVLGSFVTYKNSNAKVSRANILEGYLRLLEQLFLSKNPRAVAELAKLEMEVGSSAISQLFPDESSQDFLDYYQRKKDLFSLLKEWKTEQGTYK